MSSPIFEAMNRQGMPDMGRIAQEVRRMQSTFKGDPRAEVMKLVQSGQMSQAQLNQYQQQASQILRMMGGRL